MCKLMLVIRKQRRKLNQKERKEARMLTRKEEESQGKAEE